MRHIILILFLGVTGKVDAQTETAIAQQIIGEYYKKEIRFSVDMSIFYLETLDTAQKIADNATKLDSLMQLGHHRTSQVDVSVSGPSYLINYQTLKHMVVGNGSNELQISLKDSAITWCDPDGELDRSNATLFPDRQEKLSLKRVTGDWLYFEADKEHILVNKKDHTIYSLLISDLDGDVFILSVTRYYDLATGQDKTLHYDFEYYISGNPPAASPSTRFPGFSFEMCNVK